MQDRDTDPTVWVNIRMPHFANEPHVRRIVWIVVGELELRLEVASFVQCVFRTFEDNIPQEKVVVVLQSNARAKVIIALHVGQLLC